MAREAKRAQAKAREAAAAAVLATSNNPELSSSRVKVRSKIVIAFSDSQTLWSKKMIASMHTV